MDAASLYRTLMKSDPSGRTAALFLKDCKSKGIDVSGIEGASPPSAAKDGSPRPYRETPNARAMATIDQWGRPVRIVQHHLTGAARREFEQLMGGTATPAQLGSIRLVAPGQCGVQIDPRNGRRVCSFGDSSQGPIGGAR